MANRAVTKELAGIEDLLLGTGSVNQTRGGNLVPVTKVDASGLIYESAETLRTRFGKKIEVLTNVTALQALATATVAETFIYLLGYATAGDGGGGLFWLDTTDTTTVEDLNIVFNPDDIANGRWKRVDTADYMSPDRGDANYTVQAFDFGTQLYSTALTANRTVTLPTTGLYKGKLITVLRTAGGSFNLLVGSVSTLTGKGLVELRYDGSAWVIITEPATVDTSDFNGSFELDVNNNGEPDNWTLTPLVSATIASDPTDSAHGLTSLNFTSGGNGGGSAVSKRFDVAGGQTRSIRFNYKSSTVDTLNKVQVRTYDRAGVLLSTIPVYSEGVANPLVFTTKSGVATFDATASTAEIVLTGIDATSTSKGAGVSTNFDMIEVTDISIARGALVTLTATTTVTNNLLIPFDTEVYDTDSMHDNAVNPTRLTVPKGVTKVQLKAGVSWGLTTATGLLYLTFYKNGSIAIGNGLTRDRQEIAYTSGTVGPLQEISSAVLEVVEGDYFEVDAGEVVGVVTSIVGAGSSWFAMEVLG